MKSKKKLIVFGVEIVVILAMLGVLYFVMKQPDDGGYSYVEITPEEVVNSEVLQRQEEKQQQAEAKGEEPTSPKYMNIALFGVDAIPSKDETILKGVRSDCIMIASVNLETYDVKLVSVYRDTYLNLSDDTYEKCNGAYSYGGAPQAVKMLNMNLDMDITKFITVGYQGLSEAIDALGGVYITVEPEEVEYINSYQQAVIDALGQSSYTPVTKSGYQLVNGIQATAYCRIRATAGSDFTRTSRQREVLLSLQDQAKKASAATLIKIFENITNDIYTSYTNEEILEYLPNISKFNVVAQDGFPQEKMRDPGVNMGVKGSCIVPLDLVSNVQWLHKFLFDEENYEVTNTVKEIAEKIKSDTAPYMERSNR